MLNKSHHSAGQRNSRSSSSEGCPPLRARPQSNSSSEGYSPRVAGTSMTDMIAASKTGHFDLDDTTSIYSSSFCRVCMDQARKISKCRLITSLAKFVRTGNKNFLDWSTINVKSHSLETAKNEERQGQASYSRGSRDERLSGNRGRPYYTYKGTSGSSTVYSEGRGLRTGAAMGISKTYDGKVLELAWR